MKKKKNKIRELFEVVKDIEKTFEENINSIPENEVEKIKILFSEASAINKRENKIAQIGAIFTILFVIAIGIYTYTDYRETDNLINDVKQKTNIITELDKSNKKLNSFVRGKKDSLVNKTDSNQLNINALKNTYKIYFNLIDSLYKTNFEKEVKIIKSDNKLKIIKETYGITIKEENNKYSINAAKVDSALRLYPYFKDRMTFDDVKKIWIISVYK